MISRLRLLTSVFALFVAASSLAGCSFEPGERTQLAGQECFSDDQCVEGLLCVERVCKPQAGVTGSDAGVDADVDTPDDATDVPPGDDVPFLDVGQDAGQMVCEPGSRRCGGRQVLEICSEDGTRYFQRECEGDLVCQNGRCVDPGGCEDRDGDGYCADEDCDDADRSINPGIMESCDTPYDDNCDGQVNENCTECCPGGCGDGEFCSNCQCAPVDPNTCQFQDQPCSQEGWNNGFYCTSIDNSGDMRCLGICQRNADDPDSTCPNPGSVCAFGDGEQGVCLSGCTISQGCGLPGWGCLPYDGSDREGICVPTNPNNRLGDSCDSDAFFDCEEGAICLDLQRGARCVPACRAFSNAFNSDTDCANGHCVPLTDRLGMCRPDAGNATEGDQCNQRQVFSACNQDAVTCVPSGQFQDPECTRFCRLSEGDDDCGDDQDCYQYDQQREDLGACIDDAP
ncbi:hypothetical protein FIV42_14800 [Persicimonas caeni]|uniref:Uncharacterized protein n=1 Tax=Persicimonas caeni TaxID=2292766 RepID=A0A4Y6PUF1_PERCE|nr:hypothetical protein [Persicimonas caeni]QDG51961.1 hypothetical protein FIV42_14800 [Persicimonas caeni]QED33182.1 hypothetical protein FRD00_14795 [Persicimonas caeni]